jgi:hypothetical protein
MCSKSCSPPLQASPLSLRRDEYGSWRITGKSGHIYTSGTWVMYVCSGSPRRWSADKKRLSFCKVTQNGDDEGCLQLFGLPSPGQAKAHSRRPRHSSADALLARRSCGQARGSSVSPRAEKSANRDGTFRREIGDRILLATPLLSGPCRGNFRPKPPISGGWPMSEISSAASQKSLISKQ